jgi:spermidine/putrescine transport system substrate-binding protein
MLFVTVMLLVGMSCFSVHAEELRIMTYEGTTPEDRLEAFTQMVKDKYAVDLEISVLYIADPGEYYKALRNKQVDIINGPHNTLKDPRYKFIQGKLILPLDLENIPNYADLIPSLQNAEYATEEGEVYAVPFAYAPYGLAYNTNVLSDPPDSWASFWDPNYAGKYAIGSDYEQNIYITALAMGIERGQLGQYDAVSSPEFLEKLTVFVKNANGMWIGVDTADVLQGMSFSTAWGFSFADLKNRGENWAMAAPKEGVMGAVGNWMISHTLREKPQLKQIAEEWLNYVISPDYQLNHLVRNLSTAPTNLSIKDQMTPEEVAAFHLDDPDYFEKYLIPYPILDSRSRKGFELLWKKATR